jgi:hypothetical protein
MQNLEVIALEIESNWAFTSHVAMSRDVEESLKTHYNELNS